MSTILEAKGITKSFGMLKALDDVSIEVMEKGVTILVGPNGSGKTTLINVISGYYKADAGSVVFQGKEITGRQPHRIYKAGLSRTFQIPSLFPKLTVLEHLLVAEKGNPGESFLRSIFKRSWLDFESQTVSKAAKILEIVGLDKVWDNPATTLSGGQMKLLEIARALMSDSKLMLLDEPISGVNPTLAHQIFGRILKLRDDLGISFLIIEHRLDIALAYVDVVAAMAFGKVIAFGKPEVVMTSPKVIESYLGA